MVMVCLARSYAERIPLTLETHPVNLGLGATVRDGLTKSCQLADPGDVIVTMDADNSHDPNLIPRMVWSLREGRDVIIASRYRQGSNVRGVPFARRVFSPCRRRHVPNRFSDCWRPRLYLWL